MRQNRTFTSIGEWYELLYIVDILPFFQLTHWHAIQFLQRKINSSILPGHILLKCPLQISNLSLGFLELQSFQFGQNTVTCMFVIQELPLQ